MKKWILKIWASHIRKQHIGLQEVNDWLVVWFYTKSDSLKGKILNRFFCEKK